MPHSNNESFPEYLSALKILERKAPRHSSRKRTPLANDHLTSSSVPFSNKVALIAVAVFRIMSMRRLPEQALGTFGCSVDRHGMCNCRWRIVQLSFFGQPVRI